jgi:N6-adenosine-specific RNA methylase IME4
LPVGAIAEDDAILWLWTTNAQMRVAFEVIAALGLSTKPF